MVESAATAVVVDASAVVDLLVNGRPMPHAAALSSPAHMDAEVLSALGRLYRHGQLTAFDVEEMLDDLAALAIERVSIQELTAMAFTLRRNVALRDGLYVALAQMSGARLNTTDARLARACAGQGLCLLLVPPQGVT
jgi:predicted nucleic acid-binding protein